MSSSPKFRFYPIYIACRRSSLRNSNRIFILIILLDITRWIYSSIYNRIRALVGHILFVELNALCDFRNFSKFLNDKSCWFDYAVAERSRSTHQPCRFTNPEPLIRRIKFLRIFKLSVTLVTSVTEPVEVGEVSISKHILEQFYFVLAITPPPCKILFTFVSKESSLSL